MIILKIVPGLLLKIPQLQRKRLDAFSNGRIDVLINNAGSFLGGYFEELGPKQIEHQLATNLIGPMNITRAVLPVMRRQQSGHILAISSGAGIQGFEFNAAYSASKFGLEGWMESLQGDVEPFGIKTTIVNPGFFRTEFLTNESTTFAEVTIEEYAECRNGQQDFFINHNGKQAGDPTKLAQALIKIVNEEQPPRRFIAGADAVGIAEQKIFDLQKQIDAYRELSISMDYQEAKNKN